MTETILIHQEVHGHTVLPDPAHQDPVHQAAHIAQEAAVVQVAVGQAAAGSIRVAIGST